MSDSISKQCNIVKQRLLRGRKEYGDSYKRAWPVVGLTAAEKNLGLIQEKMHRIQHGLQRGEGVHKDSVLDIAGYAILVLELLESHEAEVNVSDALRKDLEDTFKRFKKKSRNINP